jgi:hypothetical protein
MRFIRKQVLDQRSPADRSLYVDIGGEIVMDQPFNLRIPKGTSAQRAVDNTTFTNGMIRYNSTTDEFEGYQSGAWRSFRFKEPGNIIFQDLGTGNAVETTFGPLSPDPYATPRAQSGVTWNATQMAKNIIVIAENVIQNPNVNFTVVQNPVAGPGAPYAAGTYIVFGTPVPMSKPVYVLHGFDR